MTQFLPDHPDKQPSQGGVGGTTIKPILHCDAKLLALGTFASPNAKDSTFGSPDARIPTCWYLLR